MLQLPKPNTFADYAGQPVLSTRPATSAYGLTVTPGNNAYGSYATGGVLSANTGYGLWITIQNIAVSTAAKDALVTIGLDGVDWIVDLLGSCANPLNLGGVLYYFPIIIPPGASLSAKASVNNVTVGTARVILTTAVLPSRAPNAWYGTYVRTYGSTPASSSGTAITPGTTSDGTWTSLGTVAAGDAIRYLEFGFGINNATTAAMVYGVDVGVGDGTNFKIASENTMVWTTSAEAVSKPNCVGGWCDAFPGDGIYGRMQGSGTPDTGISMAAYGVG
jgi:hypothetical protein